MKDIFDDSYSRASPVLSKKILDEDQLKIFTSYFDYPIWRGHLEGRYLLDNGDYGERLEEWGGDCSDEPGTDGDAGCEMARHGRGRVLTNVNGSLIDFRSRNVYALKNLVNPEGLDIDGDGDPGTAGDALVVIGYTLNSGFEDGKYKATRDEDWPLGDIYNSSPVWVCPPSASASYRPGYEDFAEKYADRSTMLYVGANDGMVHAFLEENGQESWAFIPASVLNILNEFRDGHRFTVDLKIKAADVLTEEGWKTILASGLREGGRHYYALDVTDPLNPRFMWEITDDNLGKTYSIPSFGQIAIEGVNTGVLFFGGGYSTKADMGNRVYIVRADNGKILSELTVGASPNNVPSELLTVRFPDSDENLPYRFHTGEAVPSVWRGNTEFCYFGDMSGTLWRLGNLNSEYGSPWEPTLEPLFVPEHPRPVTHKPAIWDETDNCQRRFIEFGTGDELNPAILTQNHFYEIEDIGAEDYQAEHPGLELTADQIAEGRFRLKWQYDFSFGEQLLTDPTTYYGLVYFITYKPSGGCSAGMSYAYCFTTSQCHATSGGSSSEEEEEEEEGGTGDEIAGTGPESEGTGGGEWFGFPDMDAYEKDKKRRGRGFRRIASGPAAQDTRHHLVADHRSAHGLYQPGRPDPRAGGPGDPAVLEGVAIAACRGSRGQGWARQRKFRTGFQATRRSCGKTATMWIRQGRASLPVRISASPCTASTWGDENAPCLAVTIPPGFIPPKLSLGLVRVRRVGGFKPWRLGLAQSLLTPPSFGLV